MNRTLTSYNQSAKEYDRKFSAYEPYRRQIKRFITLFDRKAKILDIGCGSGLNSQLFAKAGHSVVGICLSFIIVHLKDQDADKLIDRASKLLEPGGYIYISFMTGKAAGYETTSFSSSEIFFNYFEAEHIIGQFRRNNCSMEYSDTEPYTEKNGSVTEDVFLVFRKDDKLEG